MNENLWVMRQRLYGSIAKVRETAFTVSLVYLRCDGHSVALRGEDADVGGARVVRVKVPRVVV